jgi:HEAT repeats
MKRLQWLLVVLALPACALPAQAQIFFKKARPAPAQRVPELILTLKTETDERKRATAAEELREYDAKTFTEIVPVLIDVLHNDKKTNVRMEALNSLYRVRPVSQPAGQAIEYAASSDESLRVRLQAKTALLKYHLAGYSSSNKNEPSVFQPTTQEPPLADPASPAIPAVAFPPASGSKVPTPAFGPPTTLQPAGPALDVPRPLPKGISLQPGQVPASPTIQIEGPAPPPRPF